MSGENLDNIRVYECVLPSFIMTNGVNLSIVRYATSSLEYFLRYFMMSKADELSIKIVHHSFLLTSLITGSTQFSI